jgi:hypothetical protein
MGGPGALRVVVRPPARHPLRSLTVVINVTYGVALGMAAAAVSSVDEEGYER